MTGVQTCALPIFIRKIKMKGGLYHVYAACPKHSGEYAGKAKVLSIDKLHHHLGHVSHERARLLVKKGLVEGVELDMSSKATVCESREWAKGEQKAIVKVWEGAQSSAVGDEVHVERSDKTLLNHSFYPIFTYFLHFS